MKTNVPYRLIKLGFTFIFGVSSLCTFAQSNVAPNAKLYTNVFSNTTYPPERTNDKSIPTCGTQECWFSWSPTSSVNPYLEWEWATPQVVDKLIIFHAQTNARYFNGAVVESWDGSAWVKHHSFGPLTVQCENTVTFNPVATTRLRITTWTMASVGQYSNPNFREIEVWTAPSTDLSLSKLSLGTNPLCAGVESDVTLTITNNGPKTAKDMMLALDMPGQSRISVTLPLNDLGVSKDTIITISQIFKSTLSGSTLILSAINMTKDLKASNDTASLSVTIKPSPTGADLLKGSPFKGVYNSGTKNSPDMAAQDRTLVYELQPPTKFNNTTYGTAWFISSLSIGSINGTPIPSADTTLILPGSAGNGILRYTPSNGWEDSTILIVAKIYDVAIGCDSVVKRYIYVASTPRPNFIGQDVCLGDPMEFVNKSTLAKGLMTYFWDFDDGETSDFESPIHLFTRSGLFRVRLTATSDLGIVSDTVIDINVFEIPDIRFTVTNQCEGIAVKFNNTTTISSGSLSYKWDFGDGTSDITESPSHLYAKAGGYKVTLVAEANNCQSTLTKNASQFARPKAAFTNSGDCSGKEVSFVNTSTIALGEKIGTQWFYGDGDIGTQANQKHIYVNAGTKSVKMIAVSQFGCKDSLTRSLVIKPSPVADFTYDKICDVDPVNFTNTSAEPAGVDVIYNWEFGDGGVSTQKDPTHKYNTLGPKRITLMATAINGCFTQIDKDVEVLVQPVANFEVSNGCSGEQINFVNKSTVSKGDLVNKWTFGDGNTSNVVSPRKTYNPTVSTTYIVVLETTVPGGCSDKFTKSVDIKEQPSCGFTAKISPNDRRTWTFTPSNSLYGPNAYTWVFEGSGVSTDVNPTHTFDYYDYRYRVIMRVKTPDGCECLDSGFYLTTSWGLGVNDQKVNDGMKLYPNPSTGVITLELSDWTLNEQATVTVFDATGREVKSIDMATGIQIIDLDEMSNGMYTVRVDRRNSKRPSRTTRIILRR